MFLNRLHDGMRLQSDPTVVYAASDGAGVLDHRLTRAELETPSAYNTYVVTGLPPGPICAPGLGSIDAVLHPAASDDLYFVADGSGGHAFARTLPEHLRNVAHLRALTAAPAVAPALPAPGTPQ
ncbi:periplasmic solute-binding protein [Acidisphaera rubrifaciens HS-AP3]|uniref:Periplasmic solute-binding protein n=1 Tax=Acidisphaera rubrifaciens HS-AP3 TaxID=1231350 RepID=A0A0D6P9F8_9PROT|nr:periplasmic solute-binding protein [Acidisphaera rubrifaciens HS-AP3]